MRLQHIIETHWYTKFSYLLAIILGPFSLIYGLIVVMRQLLFKLKLKPVSKLPVPVVIIGNISVGGSGKTPLTKALASELTACGIRVGIILRGYKSTVKGAKVVVATDDSKIVGDEALLYAQAGFKVVIGSKRVAAGELLLRKYPQTQIILADDGLQHYYLWRDLEVCVIDSHRMLGNQCLLPLGPLREPLSRLKMVDFIVINGQANKSRLEHMLARYNKPLIYQHLEFECLYNPQSGEKVAATALNGQNLLVMSAIGNPERFYAYLCALGVKFSTVKSFPDHYSYQVQDIPGGYTILTSEKDYTKLVQFNSGNIWVVKVNAKLDNDLLVKKILQLEHVRNL